jgi:uncharacterized protein
MSRNVSVATFAVLIVALLGLVWLHTGSLLPPSAQDAIWFHAGLLTLLVGRYIVEYRITKPNDVFVNCMVVFASVSTLTNPPLQMWWELVRWGALACASIAIILAWDPGREARTQEKVLRRSIYLVVTRLGQAEVIFSIVFLIALLSYFDLQSRETRIFVITWGVFVLAGRLNLAEISRLIVFPRSGSRKILGSAHSFLAPSIVFCRKLTDERIGIHRIVGFAQGPNDRCHCLGLVIGDRSSATETRVAIALIGQTVQDAAVNERTYLVSVSDQELLDAQPPLKTDQIDQLKRMVGTVAKGTNIGRLKFEIFGNPTIAAGTLLLVTSEKSVYYQVFNGIIDEEQTVSDSVRAFVEGEAEQVGYWDDARGGFGTHDWVARERAPVFMVGETEPPPPYAANVTEITIGKIPNSNFLVYIDVHDLVLYHAAVLGITGSGKSFLTYQIVEECATRNIKVLCIDPTGDYQRYLPNAVLVTGDKTLKAFLKSPDHRIAIHETAISSTNPIEQTLKVLEIVLEWCKQNLTPEEVLQPRPKIHVVMEEAHLLVPEWNFNPQPGLRDKVNAISQIVLQARKYGLGFLIVSQRTANVVKSVLNQCNTIVSFQAFDETGFEFLRNYMGSFHVQSLPNLRPRHGIVVGKASRTRRPVMVQFHEQARVIRRDPAAPMPVIAEVIAPAEGEPAEPEAVAEGEVTSLTRAAGDAYPC